MRKTADREAKTPDQPEGHARKKKSRATGALECALGVLLGLAGLAFSRLGNLWLGFDVFSQFTAHFVLVVLAFTAGWLVPRARLTVAFLLLLFGVVGIGAWPHIASRSPSVLGEPGPGERALSVVTFNTLWVNEDVGAVSAELERLDADVVTLIEMSPAKHRVLEALSGRYPYRVDCFRIDYCKLAILSKLPIVRSEARAGWDGPPYILAKLGPEAGGLTVVGVHTIRFPHSRTQFRQVTEMASLIERVPGRKLVMGDFNATPFSRILSVIEDRANLKRITNLPSWPAQAGLPQIAIDHIFISPGVRQIEAARIGEAAGSDHYPVFARIAVPAGR